MALTQLVVSTIPSYYLVWWSEHGAVKQARLAHVSVVAREAWRHCLRLFIHYYVHPVFLPFCPQLPLTTQPTPGTYVALHHTKEKRAENYDALILHFHPEQTTNDDIYTLSHFNCVFARPKDIPRDELHPTLFTTLLTRVGCIFL